MRLYKEEATESRPIVLAVLAAVLQWAPSRGREGADLRAKVGIVRVNVDHMLMDNTLGEPMAEIFDLAREGGITLAQVDKIRWDIEHLHRPSTVGAIVVKDCLIDLMLVTEGRIIAGMEFRSRQDVEFVQERMNESFNDAAEYVADRMDSMTYRAIVSLHAAITFFLIEVARPRPRMMNFRFNQPLPTLVQAYRLYADASRADELRYENQVVHPAFPPMLGRGLSA